MKLSILFGSLAVLIAAPVRAEHIKVFLLAGQSNMAGSGTLVSALPTTPSNLQMPQDDILFYSGSELAAAFGTLQPGGGDAYGPEITFGRAIADALPHQKFGIIKHGRSVTSLYSSWYAPNGGEYVSFRSTVSYGLDAFARAGHTCEIVGMLWTQGETDATNGRTTAQYEADLIAFIADIRSRYGANLPFYLSRLSTNQTNVANISTVRAAQENVANADPFTYMIDTDSFLVRSDKIHFSGPGQIALGQAFAQAWLTNSIEATAPGLSTLSPAHSATAIDPTTNLSITFSENIAFGTGAITLRQSGGELVESFNVDPSSANLTISGSTLTINPTSLLSPSTGYYLEIDATAIDDLVGNSYPGFSGPGTWSFTTSAADNTPPGISSLSPAHSATGVLFNSNLRITFTENIAFGTGEIRLRQSGGALVQSFDVANPPAGLSLSGATVTINPSAELAISTGYYLEIDATAIVDHAGNSFAGFSGNGTWSFTATAGLIPGSRILATASTINSLTDHPSMTVNGSGLSGGVHSSVAPSTVWSTGTVSPANVWIQWDLGSSYLLDSIHAWNLYNPTTANGGGIKSVDIYYSNAAIPGDPEGVGASNWTKLGGATLELPEAPATNNTGFDLATATSTTLPTTEVRYVRFELNSNWVGNRTGLAEIQFTVKPIGPDTTAPSVSTLSPTHTATGVATSSDLSVTFNENVAFGTGAIRIRRQSDNALIESFDVASPPSGLSLSGATVTLNPTADLANLTAYYVEIDATAIVDPATNSFPGITGNGTWSFTTVGAETVPPTTSSLSPAHNATGISYASNLSINFSENVAFGTGAIRLRRQSDNSLIESFDVASPPSGLTISGTTVTLNPAYDLSPATTYYVEIDATAIDDLAGNSFAGFSGSGTWSFTTFVPDTTDPTISTRNPANAATGVPASSNLVITFSENVAFGTGAITLRQAGGTLVESFDVASPPSGLTISGATVTLNPTSNLELATTYYVEIDATAIDDLAGNSFAGFSGDGTWSFTSILPDTTAPTISTRNPANSATGVSPSANPSITFSENVVFGTGAITLRQAGGALVESFNVASPPAGLTLSGATVTLNPASDLALSTSYYVEIDATAIDDFAGNSFEGFTGDSTWSFTISNSAQSTFTLADSYLASLDVSSATSLFVTPGFPSFLDGPLIGSSDLTITGFFSSSNNQLSLVNNTGNSFTGNIIVDSGALRIAGSPFASNGGFTAGSMTASDMITINRAGTLFIDDTVTGGYTADRFGSGASSARPAVVMNGGAFSYTGANNAAVMTQTLGDLTLSAGLSTFTVNRTSNGTPTLVFDSLTQASGSIVQFASNTAFGSAATNVAKITFTNSPTTIGGGGAEGTNTISLVKGAKTPTVSGNSNFFVYGANGIRPLALGTETDDRGGNINGATTTANVRLNDSTATTITALSGPTTVNSLIIGGAAINTAQTWAMGNTLTLTSGMLMRTLMNQPFTFTSGTLTAGDGTNPADLSISVPNGTMFIGGTTNITNNGSSVVSLVVPDSLTINSTTNSTYSGGTYVLGGTLALGNVANTRYLGAGKVFVKGGTLNLGNIGATSFSGSLAYPNYTVTDGGRIGLANVNHGSAEFFNIEANSIIGGGAGSGTGLASLTRGTNITLAPGAIIQHNALTAALNLTTGTIQNPGTAADLYYGINNNQNNVSGSINIGNGTAFRGISTDRSGRAWQQGTINIASGTTSVDFQGHATHGTAAVLTLGNGATAGNPVINFAGSGTVDINALGALTLNDNAAVYGNQNVRFVAKAGSTLTITAATGMGSGTGIASVLVNNGGILAIGASNALNGAVTVEAGGQFNANLAGGLTGDGALTFNEDSILNIVSQALAFSGAQASAATVNAGTIVRLGVNSYGAVGDPLDNYLGAKSPIYQLTGNNAAANPTSAGTTIMTLSKNGSGIGGILTNDNSSRSPGALANGVITLGANGGVIAATTGTTLTVAENISGGALTIGTTAVIDGAPKQGIVSLTATTNDYAGGTTVNTGTLTMGGAYTVLGSNSGSLTVNGGTLNMAGNSLTVGNLTGTGGVISGTANARTLTIGQGDFGGGDYQGVIANGAGGSTALTKNGGGTITLSGTNSYTGVTTISAGKLIINGDQTSATGNVTVASNATLGGTGTIGGSTTILTGGKLEFDLSTAAGSHNPLDMASGKTLSFSGASTLTITSINGAEPGIYTLVTGGNNITGVAPATLNLPDDWVASVSISGNNLLLNVTSTGSAMIDHFAISSIASPQTVGTPITGITLTAKSATDQTVTSFTGTVTFGGTAGVTGTSANFVAGVLSGVSVTPTVAGVVLNLTVDDGAGHTGSATFTVRSVFDDWANVNGLTGGDAAAGANPDGDQLTNLQEFAFGMDPASSVSRSLAYEAGGNVLTTGSPILQNFAASGQPADYQAVFARRKNHIAAGLTYAVQFSADLSLWTASSTAPTTQTGTGSSGEMEAVSIPFPSSVPLQTGGSAAPKFFRVAVTENGSRP